MDSLLAMAEMSTPSLVLRYAAAFFFVVVAIALAYALVKAARALQRVDKVLADVDDQGIPLMEKAGVTLDGVNANLGNVDEITKDVAGITDKIDSVATAVEGVVSTPARKAAAFSAGVQSAVSSFMRRDRDGESAAGQAAAGAAAEQHAEAAQEPPEPAAGAAEEQTAEPAAAGADAGARAAASDSAESGAETPTSEGSPWDSPTS
jgi:uncharacterized protein YoxC